MTTLQARAVYTMVYELPLPQEGYEEARGGIDELKKQAKGPFCRETGCKKAGVHKNRRGYLVCKTHIPKVEKELLVELRKIKGEVRRGR